MVLPYDKQFKAEVIEIARKREVPIAQIAKDFRIDVFTIRTWLRKDTNSHVSAVQSIDLLEENRELQKRNRLLEQEIVPQCSRV